MARKEPLDERRWPGATRAAGGAVVDGVGGASPKIVRSVIDRDVHFGGLCAKGSACGGSDRTLLDFFESDMMPDGRIVLTYAADPHSSGKYAEIRAAIQNGGTPLLVRPVSPSAK